MKKLLILFSFLFLLPVAAEAKPTAAELQSQIEALEKKVKKIKGYHQKRLSNLEREVSNCINLNLEGVEFYSSWKCVDKAELYLGEQQVPICSKSSRGKVTVATGNAGPGTKQYLILGKNSEIVITLQSQGTKFGILGSIGNGVGSGNGSFVQYYYGNSRPSGLTPLGVYYNDKIYRSRLELMGSEADSYINNTLAPALHKRIDQIIDGSWESRCE
ncbi:MAG: hypothetical protein OXC97_07925 [Candidatus Dadabacteria bacterium]|nr:hypothetical protein [Candidatus Dadabacteria bacterium]